MGVHVILSGYNIYNGISHTVMGLNPNHCKFMNLWDQMVMEYKIPQKFDCWV